MNNIAVWFEIPVSDKSRAIRFYEEVFVFKLTRMPLEGLYKAWFTRKAREHRGVWYAIRNFTNHRRTVC